MVREQSRAMKLQKFADELRAGLKADKTPLAEISKATGISVSLLEKFRNGRAKNPTLKTLISIWQYLG